MDGNTETGASISIVDYSIKSGVHIPVLWIPAIPAGMTDRRVIQTLMYNDDEVQDLPLY